MWENETAEVKQMYDRKCKEEVENSDGEKPASLKIEKTLTEDKSNAVVKEEEVDEDMLSMNPSLTNRSMTLETAAQFASLVAARHVDMSTRDFLHLDINTLLEQSIVSQHGLEEI